MEPELVRDSVRRQFDAVSLAARSDKRCVEISRCSSEGRPRHLDIRHRADVLFRGSGFFGKRLTGPRHLEIDPFGFQLAWICRAGGERAQDAFDLGVVRGRWKKGKGVVRHSVQLIFLASNTHVVSCGTG